MQLLFASLVLLPAAVLASSYEGSALKDSSLKYHNQFRTEHAAPALKWDDDVAAAAQSHASKCHYGHSSNSKYGENIAAGYDSPEKAVLGWGNERDQYDFGNQGFSSECGHFTQIVWKETLSVGCGAALCDGLLGSGKQWFYVCNYEKPGNVQGQYEQNVSPKTKGYKQKPVKEDEDKPEDKKSKPSKKPKFEFEDKPTKKPVAKPEPSYDDYETDDETDKSPSYSDNEDSDDEYDSDNDSDYSGKTWKPKKWNAYKKWGSYKKHKKPAHKKWTPKKWGGYKKHDNKPKYDSDDEDNKWTPRGRYHSKPKHHSKPKYSSKPKYNSKPKYESDDEDDYTPSY